MSPFTFDPVVVIIYAIGIFGFASCAPHNTGGQASDSAHYGVPSPLLPV